jgi:hypothetical protein
MHDLALVLASGGTGARKVIMWVMLAVIVVLAVGWATYAAKVRAGRRNKR